MFRTRKLSRADAYTLFEAGEIAEAQMRLVEQVRAGTGAFAHPLRRRLGNPALLISVSLMVAASALMLGGLA